MQKLTGLLLIAFFSIPLSAIANDSVQLQLKWRHSFQSAGFYMALEKGFYRDAGLEVTIIEGGPGKMAVEHALSGEASYAVGDTGALIAYAEGKKVTALAAMFQHSPLALLVLQQSNIRKIDDLRGKRIMLQSGYQNTDILAALASAGIGKNDFVRQSISYDIKDLINGNTDAFAIYITDQPHQLDELGISYRIFHPNDYGIDFYGDILIASAIEVSENPERVNAMIDASMKGWHYTFEHMDEAIRLILEKYNSQGLSSGQLHFEAKETAKLMLEELVNPGYMSSNRWHHIRNTYIKQGLLPVDLNIDDFIYQRAPTLPETLAHYRWQLLLTLLLIITLFLAIQTLLLRRSVRIRTEKLRESLDEQRKLSQAIEQAGEAILITDKQGIITYVNPAFQRITGYSDTDAIGNKPSMLNSGEHPESHYQQMWDTISSGEVWKGKCIEKRKDGTLYPVMQTISPIRNEQNEITHYVAVHEDMSELEAMEKRFYQAQKMEAVGTLVGGIAHDFNNMLAAVSGNLFLAQQEIGDYSKKATGRLDKVHKLVFRAADMISQLLTFASKNTVNRKPLPLGSFVRETIKLHKVAIPENIELKVGVIEELHVNADATQLQQLIMNLLSNARDAVTGVYQPEIRISLTRFEANSIFAAKHHVVRGTEYAELIISDNGHGIPDETLQHVFEPFYTTKEVGKGSGLGLSMVFGAVQSHEGVIEVESTEGKGSSFHIFLPIIESEVLAGHEHAEHAVHGVNETILMAEDEQEVSDINREIFELLGYRVISCSDGEEAVRKFRAEHNVVDLVILDLVMPNMGGVAAAKMIRQINPDIPLLFVSGYDVNESLRDEAAELYNYLVLSKPFTPEDASIIIRKALDESGRQ